MRKERLVIDGEKNGTEELKSLPRKFNLISAAALGAIAACIITIFREGPVTNRSPANGLGYWFGVAIGGALMFVVVSMIMNRYRR